MRRIRLTIQGAVQGVGFRPFVFRLAAELNLTGSVANTASGVITEVQGGRAATSAFARRVLTEAPPVSQISSSQTEELDTRPEETEFVILASQDTQAKTVTVLPDLTVCPRCLEEIDDPNNRRFGYPFTNCTDCGPRYSIINDLPYDRPNTEMRAFEQCPECLREYNDPHDRRFHAQPNACPCCGPQLELLPSGDTAADPFAAAIQLLELGGILALKGIGGYQLLCDARHAQAVQELRRRKQREEKPLAVMFPNLESVKEYCHLQAGETLLLQSHVAPIVLLQRRPESDLAPAVASRDREQC